MVPNLKFGNFIWINIRNDYNQYNNRNNYKILIISDLAAIDSLYFWKKYGSGFRFFYIYIDLVTNFLKINPFKLFFKNANP